MRLATTLFALTLAASAAPAQTPNQATPTLKVYSRETIVDVTVTDKDGKPVHGLTQSDFTLKEDNKPQPIRSFQEFGSDVAIAIPPPPELPPNTYTNLQPAGGPLYVLLFDDINGGDGPRVRAAAAKFIKSMTPGTRVALLALGAKLNVLQGPTSDPSLLLKSVNNRVDPYTVAAIACVKQVALDWATLDQLQRLASYLSGIKGRKNLIWIGNGISDMTRTEQTSYGGCQDFTGPLQKAYDLLEDAQITIYPLDPKGVHPLGPMQLSMEAVAEATGGVALYESNDLASLMTKAVDSGSSYYTLSYVPRSVAYDGRYHSIGIKVSRANLHLVYRQGYSAEDPTQIARPPSAAFGVKTREAPPAANAPDPLAAALSPVAPPATQLLFDVRVAPATEPENPFDPPILGELNPKARKTSLARFDFLYMVPQSQIAFAGAVAGTYNGSLEFDVVAFDPDGKLVNIRSQTMKLPLTGDEYKQFIETPFRFLMQLDLPPGQLSLRVGVLDQTSNKIGTLDIPLTVPQE